MLGSFRFGAVAFAGAGLLMAATGLLSTVISLRVGEAGAAARGAILAAYYVGLLIGARWCGLLIRRVGHIRAFATLCLSAAACALGHGLVVHSLGWLVLRASCGFCLAGLFMVLESWLCDRSGPRALGRTAAAYVVVLQLGLGLGQVVVPVVGTTGDRPFSIAAVLLCLAALPVLVTTQTEPAMARHRRLGVVSVASRFPLAVAAACASGVLSGAMVTLGPIFAERMGLSLAQISAFVVVLAVGGTLLQAPLSLASDERPRPSLLAIAAGGVFVASVSLALHPSPGALTWYLVTALLGGSAFSLYPLALAHANDEAAPWERVDLSAALLAAWAFSAAAGTIVGSWSMSAFGPVGLLATTALTAIGLLAFCASRRAPAGTRSRIGQRGTG